MPFTDWPNTAGSKRWYIFRTWNNQVSMYFCIILCVHLGVRCLILSEIAVALSFLCTFHFPNNMSDCNEICTVLWLLNLILSGPILIIHLPGMSAILNLNVFISWLFVFTTTTTLLPLVLYVRLLFEFWCLFTEFKIVLELFPEVKLRK